MRLTILRMIAAGSLSAFNAQIGSASGAARPVRGTPRQPARARTPSLPLATQPGADTAAAWPPSRFLPRGSLIDLSV